MRVLVTGAGGQVGVELLRLAAATGVEAVGLARRDLDVTDAEAVRRAVAHHEPDAVVHAAAYTAVDRAESQPELAFAVNRDGAAHVAEACAAAGVPLVHLSTDYVFDGTKDAPYTPDDPVAPLNVYGQSKAAGEAAVRERLDRHVILRTAWVFSGHGHNFVRTMLRLASERERLAVVADQWGHPTWAGDVARAALAAAERSASGAGPQGTLHVAGSPLTTWHGLATAAVTAAADLGFLPTRPIDPVSAASYPTVAQRPRQVQMETVPSLEALGLPEMAWRARLSEVVREWRGSLLGRRQ